MRIMYQEVCPHCNGRVRFAHDVETEGWMHQCVGCGEWFPLCSECLARDPEHKCRKVNGRCGKESA